MFWEIVLIIAYLVVAYLEWREAVEYFYQHYTTDTRLGLLPIDLTMKLLVFFCLIWPITMPLGMLMHYLSKDEDKLP